ADLGDFTIDDESYARLRLRDGSRVLAWHTHDPDGVRHPLLWLRSRGAGMVVVDLLGHDAGSFANTGHRILLERAVTPSRVAPA
ncbi:MAG: hypothetical protein ABI566_14635, partial [Pseudolysinimonas sp.]